MTELLSATWWEMIARNWAALAIALTCAAVGLWFVLVLSKYVRICLNIFSDTPQPMGISPVDFERITGEEVRFRSFDGVSLRGMWVWAETGGRPRGTIVFCHEYESDMYSFARYVRPLLVAGFNIFTFDFRGHGQSSCSGTYKPLQWPSEKELGDVLGATVYAAGRLAEEGQPTQLGLFGISRGGAAAILAAASDENAKAILCDGAFSTETVCISMMKRWASIFARIRLAYENHPDFFWRMMAWLLMRRAQRRMGCRYHSVRKALGEMAPRPIMLIHGQRDSYVLPEQTELLHAAAPPPKYMWIVPQAKHNQSVLVAPDEYAQRTVAFFRKYLANEDVDESLIAGRTRTTRPSRPVPRQPGPSPAPPGVLRRSGTDESRWP